MLPTHTHTHTHTRLVRSSIIRIRRKLGPSWRNFIRIAAINLSYVQINSSLPVIIPIEWPQSYLDFLDRFAVINIDLVSLLGMRCVGDDLWDFRTNILVACLIPILGGSLIMSCYR